MARFRGVVCSAVERDLERRQRPAVRSERPAPAWGRHPRAPQWWYRGNSMQVKGVTTGVALTLAEVTKEVAKAKKFRPKLTRLIFATTAPADARLTEKVLALAEQHNQAQLFDIVLLSWTDIVDRIDRYPALAEGVRRPCTIHFRDTGRRRGCESWALGAGGERQADPRRRYKRQPGSPRRSEDR